MKKNIKECVTNILGFKIKLLNVPILMVDGEEVVDVDFDALAEDIFFDFLRSPVRLTGDQLRFMRKHLALRQVEMFDILGLKQSTYSRFEANGNKLAFDVDMELIALKVEFAKIKIGQMKGKIGTDISQFVHRASELKNPEKTFIRKIA